VVTHFYLKEFNEKDSIALIILVQKGGFSTLWRDLWPTAKE